MGGGGRGYFGLRPETDYGAGGAPLHFLPVVGASPTEAVTPAEAAAWGAAGPEPLDPAIGATVQMNAEAQPDVLGYLLAAVLGPPVTTQVASGVWQHVFEPRAGRPSYVAEASDGSFANRADGARFSALTLAVRGGDLLRVSAQGVARRALPVATATASFATENAPRWNAATVQVSGAADLTVTDAAVTLAAPLTPVLARGRTGRIAEVVPGGPVRAGVGMTLSPQASAWLGYARLGTELSWTLLVPGSLVGTTSYQVTVQCPRVRVQAAPFASAIRTIPAVTVQAAAYPSAAAVRGVKITLVNVTSGY